MPLLNTADKVYVGSAAATKVYLGTTQVWPVGSVIAADALEAATAASTQDATVVSGVSYVTWEPATVAAVTLSGGNLVATNTGTTSANQGAHVVSTAGKTSGKYYFETTITTVTTAGGNQGIGVGTTASTYTNIGNSATVGALVYYASGNIWANGSSTGSSLGAGGAAATYVMGIAVDLGNRRIWFRKITPILGNWNGSGTADPVTNVGGITVPAGTMVPFNVFGGSGAAGNAVTTNFGASSFTGAVPSGFTSGWPV